MATEFTWSIRVYYEDTDAGGIVYYANYLKFMERARTEWLRELGFDQIELKQQHHLVFVVRQATIDYLKPALFNDVIHIKTHLTHLGKASMTVLQTVMRHTDILCTATIKIACVHADNLHPHPIPHPILEVLRNHG